MSPQNSYVEILTPEVTEVGGGALGQRSAHKWGWCPYERPQTAPVALPQWRTK